MAGISVSPASAASGAGRSGELLAVSAMGLSVDSSAPVSPGVDSGAARATGGALPAWEQPRPSRRSLWRRRMERCEEAGGAARPASPNMNGLCFKPGHLKKDCTNKVVCLRCGVEGHVVVECKRPRSPASASEEELRREALAKLLRYAVVVHVGGCQLAVSGEQVHEALVRRRGIPAGQFSVHTFQPEDFLVVLATEELRNARMERLQLDHADFSLFFRLGNRQSQAEWVPMRTKVGLVLEGVPPHIWEREVVEDLLGTSYVVDLLAANTCRRTYLALTRLSDWTEDPEGIPVVRTLVVPEPEEGMGLTVAGAEDERLKLDMLRYKVLIHVDKVDEELSVEDT
ncbi:unnamed protein product [Alopecurus aequalis]